MYIERLHLFLFYYHWFQYKIIHRNAFNTSEKKTLLESIMLSNYLSNNFVISIMQMIHSIYYVKLYFLVIYHTHSRILNALITEPAWCSCQVGINNLNCSVLGSHILRQSCFGWVQNLTPEVPQYEECWRDQAFFEIIT